MLRKIFTTAATGLVLAGLLAACTPPRGAGFNGIGAEPQATAAPEPLVYIDQASWP